MVHSKCIVRKGICSVCCRFEYFQICITNNDVSYVSNVNNRASMNPSLPWILVTLYILVVDVNKNVALIPLNSYFIMRDTVVCGYVSYTLPELLVFAIDWVNVSCINCMCHVQHYTSLKQQCTQIIDLYNSRILQRPIIRHMAYQIIWWYTFLFNKCNVKQS